jgi:hypothetical protein
MLNLQKTARRYMFFDMPPIRKLIYAILCASVLESSPEWAELSGN